MLTAETGGAFTLACILILTVSIGCTTSNPVIPAIWPATAWAHAGAFSFDRPRASSRLYTRRFASQIALTTDEVLLSAVMGHAKNLAAVLSRMILVYST